MLLIAGGMPLSINAALVNTKVIVSFKAQVAATDNSI
jgi:hypothetical protein